MEVKYIPIDIYVGPSSNRSISNMNKLGSSLMPVIIATPAEVSAASANATRMSYTTLQSTLAEKLPGIDVRNIVCPGYFGSQEAADGYYHYGAAAPSANLISFPVSISSDYYISHAIADKELTYEVCDSYPQIRSATVIYYNYDGTTFTANGPSSAAGNNTRDNRCQWHIAVLRKNGQIFDRVGIISVSVTGDGNSGAIYSFNASNSDAKLLALFNSVTMIDEPQPEDDPYGPGGESGPGGGTGTFDGTGDDIDIPSLPTLSAADTGFITLFNPSLAELKNLANYMWSDLFSLDTFKKLFADPMDAVLGLSIVPVRVPNGGSRNVTVGNISTGVSMTVAAGQYVELDCGTLNVEEYWGAYLDYDPYTKCHIYLPYIGTHPLSTDDVMGKPVHVVYHVDILSGACTAFVKCGGSVLYEFIGQVASSIPITGDNFTNVINGVLNIAGSIGTMVATGGFSAPASVAKAGLAGAYTAGHMIGAGASMAQDVMSMKPQVEMSGGMSGTGGMLAVQTPYLILERPNQAIPAGQNAYMGYPSYITDKLGDLSGYTEVEHIHLDNIPCTELEANEILQYLESGVIL